MKDKITKFFNKVSPGLNKLGNNIYLQTIMGAMMTLLGPIILGSFAVLGAVYAAKYNLTAIANLLGVVNTLTIGSMALYLAFLMAKFLANSMLNDDDGTAAGIISLMSFLIMTPLGKIVSKSGSVEAIPTTWLSSQGVFSAIIIGLLVGRGYVYIKRHGWTIKMPEGVPPMVSQAFASLIPSIVIGVIAAIISFIFTLTSWNSFHQMIFNLIQTPLSNIGGSVWAMIAVTLLMQILWFFGIHGTNVILPLVTPIWLSLDMQNLAAFKAGKEVPNMFGLAFFNVVTWGGTALGLVLLMLFVSKSKRYKEMGRLAIIPSLFGITEPVIFGTPLVLNFDFLVPFVTNNTIAIIIAMISTKLGIVAPFSGAQAVFGLPLGLHALVGGHISIVFLQLFIQLVLSPLLWFPWFKRADRKAFIEENQTK
ncbi:PTS sugar transporter subunit IIC [Liquorilactobacillus mali]|uniref:Permease IIC component n=2 Tax=Liquorilactobacillus mali TaxID=1618 RepID=A0A0R2FY55_9LACO|nr:PTS transporter subunit EIIC [Liquorilactobacillus mali]EJF01624.1 pts family oligomeric beta-glucoside porter component iic [Liquorilactobacillus mali KCTC 3596 = DSM 20444]KRN33072.1 pts family oligomeric beta-glucoside porter component iic [Liquorilactobacillus mali]MDN7145111.1 PTS transporter subunit EIIC [Liquorilactobacillus mali]